MSKSKIAKYTVLAVTIAAFLIQSCHSKEGARISQRKNQPFGTDLENTLESVFGKEKQPTSTTKTIADTASVDVVIETTLGDIAVTLFGDTPRHKKNFVKLADSGFYEGTLFHRVIKGFMVQAGDPYTKDPGKEEFYGQGGPGYTIPAEFRANHHHVKGALAAARKGDAANPYKESSGSQFYIVQDEDGCRHLDGQYTVFGQVTEGLDVIDRIASIMTDYRDMPVDEVKILKVTVVRPEPEPESEECVEVCDSSAVEAAGTGTTEEN